MNRKVWKPKVTLVKSLRERAEEYKREINDLDKIKRRLAAQVSILQKVADTERDAIIHAGKIWKSDTIDESIELLKLLKEKEA